MLHPDTELRIVSDEVVYGVFATRDIPCGTVTWALDPLDRRFDVAEVERLLSEQQEIVTRYTWLNASGRRILCWDFGRFVNHSCNANALSPGGFEFDVALRDIASGEQLTTDYAALNLEEPMACHCGFSQCRKIVQPEDFARLAPAWDERIRAAFPSVLDVAQPLWRYVKSDDTAIRRFAVEPETVPSILRHQWPPNRIGTQNGGT